MFEQYEEMMRAHTWDEIDDIDRSTEAEIDDMIRNEYGDLTAREKCLIYDILEVINYNGSNHREAVIQALRGVVTMGYELMELTLKKLPE